MNTSSPVYNISVISTTFDINLEQLRVYDEKADNSDKMTALYELFVKLTNSGPEDTLGTKLILQPIALEFLQYAFFEKPEKLTTFLSTRHNILYEKFDNLDNSVLHYLCLCGGFTETKRLLKKHKTSNDNRNAYYIEHLTNRCNSYGINVIEFCMLSGHRTVVLHMEQLFGDICEFYTERNMFFVGLSSSTHLIRNVLNMAFFWPTSLINSIENGLLWSKHAKTKLVAFYDIKEILRHFRKSTVLINDSLRQLSDKFSQFYPNSLRKDYLPVKAVESIVMANELFVTGYEATDYQDNNSYDGPISSIEVSSHMNEVPSVVDSPDDFEENYESPLKKEREAQNLLWGKRNHSVLFFIDYHNYDEGVCKSKVHDFIPSLDLRSASEKISEGIALQLLELPEEETETKSFLY